MRSLIKGNLVKFDRFLKKSIFQFKFRNTFPELQINFKECPAIFGINIMLILDRNKGLVYRCPLNELGKIAILQNYNMLQEINESAIPKPLGEWHRDGLLITAEALLTGKKIQLTDINQKLIEQIFSRLSLIYEKNIVRTRFDIENWFSNYDYLVERYSRSVVKRISRIISKTKNKILSSSKIRNFEVVNTRIHGDLSFRNIIIEDDKIFFIDFDRSEISFPEFDVLLFYLDYLTYKEGRITYESFFDNIFNFIEGKINIDWLDKFYKLNDKFCLNKTLDLELRYMFMYRVLIHILQSFSIFDLAPLKLLDKINDRL
jgi:hypothetical protein